MRDRFEGVAGKGYVGGTTDDDGSGEGEGERDTGRGTSDGVNGVGSEMDAKSPVECFESDFALVFGTGFENDFEAGRFLTGDTVGEPSSGAGHSCTFGSPE